MLRLLLLLSAIDLAACAARGPLEYEPRPNMDEIKDQLNCPSDRMPACIERIGHPYTCYCMDEDAMRKVLEPDKY